MVWLGANVNKSLSLFFPKENLIPLLLIGPFSGLKYCVLPVAEISGDQRISVRVSLVLRTSPDHQASVVSFFIEAEQWLSIAWYRPL